MDLKLTGVIVLVFLSSMVAIINGYETETQSIIYVKIEGNTEPGKVAVIFIPVNTADTIYHLIQTLTWSDYWEGVWMFNKHAKVEYSNGTEVGEYYFLVAPFEWDYNVGVYLIINADLHDGDVLKITFDEENELRRVSDDVNEVFKPYQVYASDDLFLLSNVTDYAYSNGVAFPLRAESGLANYEIYFMFGMLEDSKLIVYDDEDNEYTVYIADSYVAYGDINITISAPLFMAFCGDKIYAWNVNGEEAVIELPIITLPARLDGFESLSGSPVPLMLFYPTSTWNDQVYKEIYVPSYTIYQQDPGSDGSGEGNGDGEPPSGGENTNDTGPEAATWDNPGTSYPIKLMTILAVLGGIALLFVAIFGRYAVAPLLLVIYSTAWSGLYPTWLGLTFIFMIGVYVLWNIFYGKRETDLGEAEGGET